MKAHAVIGMNYGDEGKGHMTNYLCQGPDSLVVRFNGGAQAAHTVVQDDGTTHVFHHFGSGSLKGARTLLGSKFIVNPFAFVKELWELSAKCPVREVFIDPRCIVTTPYDMLINEFNARERGKTDTCGMGINETVERSVFRQMALNARGLVEKTDDEIRMLLKDIKRDYIPYRLKVLDIDPRKFDKFYLDNVGRTSLDDAYLKIRDLMITKAIVLCPDDMLIDKFCAKHPKGNIVFEGAQGMLLDQKRKEYFPYLTRSNTGVDNIITMLETVKTRIDLEVVLTTRSYLSRHGDGPMFDEWDKPLATIEEPTNQPNPFQGTMRYGYLNKTWYNKAIDETSRKLLEYKGKSSVVVAMTCIDQLPNSMCDKLGVFTRRKYCSYGPKETDIKEVKL